MTAGLLIKNLDLKYFKNPTKANKKAFNYYRNKFKQLQNEAEKMHDAENVFLACQNNLSKNMECNKEYDHLQKYLSCWN